MQHILNIVGILNGSELVEYDIQKLYAVPYNKLSYTRPIINKNIIPYFFWIRIPSLYNPDFDLYQIDELGQEVKELDYRKFLNRECGKPWLRINSGIFNLNAGMHTYKLSMVNPKTNDVVYLYISYIIQDDNPPKPYDYMEEIRSYEKVDS